MDTKTLFPKLNLDTMCRTCLSENYLTITCDSNITINNTDVLVSYLIKLFTNIEVRSNAQNFFFFLAFSKLSKVLEYLLIV